MKILITGSSSGIGLGLANYYVELGHDVHGISRNACIPLFSKPNYTHSSLDLSSSLAIPQLPLSDFDIVIFSAGRNQVKSFTEYSEQDIQKLFFLNSFSVIYYTQRLISFFSDASHDHQCRFVFISSIWSTLACSRRAVYGSTKASIDALFRHLSLEYKYQHSFLTLQLGFVDTPLTKKTASDYNLRPALDRSLLHQSKFSVSDVVKYISFLADPSTPFYCVNIPVDGGICL